jgi:hypothetical protein
MRVIVLSLAVVAVLYAYALQTSVDSHRPDHNSAHSAYSGQAADDGADVAFDAEVSPC